jgi:hypothetical protein
VLFEKFVQVSVWAKLKNHVSCLWSLNYIIQADDVWWFKLTHHIDLSFKTFYK